MSIANPVNPRKKFPWSIEFEGFEPAMAQRVTMPQLTVETAEHGASNIRIKTGGMVTVGDLTVNKLMFSNKNENWAYDWLKKVSNPETGTMGVPSEYKRNGYVIFYAPDLKTVLEKWQIVGAFVKDISKDELDKTSSDNLLENVVLSVDYVVRTS